MRNPNKKTGGTTVDNEVARLMRKKGGINEADFARLRSKYDDANLVSKIQNAFQERHAKVTRKAKKFAKLVREKYSKTNTPFHVLLEKALMFKKKYNLSDDEFEEFKRIYEQELAGTGSQDVANANTNMMKVLGNITTDLKGFIPKVNGDDARTLQEIVNLYRSSRSLHAQVLLQSMQYRDCDYESMTGKYNREMGMNAGQHVHPVVAALFFPKIDALEHHFLFSNIAGIVDARKSRQKLRSRADYELFYSLVTDPNDIVCSDKSPVSDLLSRANLQNQLWNSVLHLRNGQYYNKSFPEFVTSVDMCRLNRHDNPDLIYGRYDGTVIKRLVSAFSFRPTVVATTPVVTTFNMNPYSQNVRPSVRQVPMVNLRLVTSSNPDPVSLDDALEQNQPFLEANGSVSLRNTSLIYSRGVLMFYVDRRAHVMRVSDVGPFNLSREPYAVSGFERLNDRVVNFQSRINIRDDEYELRSVVVSELNRNDPSQNLVVGSSTLLLLHPQLNRPPLRHQHECYQYDPLGVVLTNQDSSGTRIANDPVVEVPYSRRGNVDGFFEMASTRGTVFVYQLVRDRTEGVVSY
jgi:hypothetical protein